MAQIDITILSGMDCTVPCWAENYFSVPSAMGFPYHTLPVCGQVASAARQGSIGKKAAMSEITKLLISAVIFLTVFVFLTYWLRRREARKALAKSKAMFSGKLEFTEVSPRDFPWLDTSFYDKVSARMTDAGFRFVGDFESLSASRQYPKLRTFIRCFIGEAGTTTAACYHVKGRGQVGAFGLGLLFGNHIRIVEFESEFTDLCHPRHAPSRTPARTSSGNQTTRRPQSHRTVCG